MNTYWEPSDNAPIIAYLCYPTSLPVFKSRKKAVVERNSDMFTDLLDALSESEDAPTGERRDYLMRLPFTGQMLERRREAGRDVPEWGM